jgi:hypothetical protein
MGLIKGFFKEILSWLVEIPEQEAIGTQVSKPASDNALNVIYGQRKTAGTIVFKGVNDHDNDDTPNDLLHIIVVWGEAVTSIDEIYLDDYPIGDSRFLVNGQAVASVANFPNGMGNYSDPYLKDAGFDPKSKDHRLDGCAVSYIRCEWIAGEDNPWRGEPSIKALLTGRQ